MDIYLKLETPLHVGAESELTRKPIVRLKVNGKYLPVIPAESIKGSLRNLAGKLAKTMEFSNPIVNDAVKYHDKDKHEGENIRKYSSEAEAQIKEIFSEEQIEELSLDDKLEYYFSLNCPICRLFGGRGVSAKINFFDAYPLVNEERKTPKIAAYTSTSIDRNLGVALEGRLYSIEFIEPSKLLRFNLKAIAENIEPGSNESMVLARLIDCILLDGFTLGGVKSKGFGLMRIDEKNSKIKIANLILPPRSLDEIKDNVLKILMKNEKCIEYDLREFTKWLTTHR